MRRIRYRVFVVIGLGIVFLLYLQAVILTTGQSLGRTHLQIEQGLHEFQLVSKLPLNHVTVEVRDITDGQFEQMKTTDNPFTKLPSLNESIFILKYLTFNHTDKPPALKVSDIIGKSQLTKTTDGLQVPKYNGSDTSATSYKPRKEDINMTNNQHAVPFTFWEKRFLVDYENALKSGRNPPLWQKELYTRLQSRAQPKQSYFLTHLLMVRLYATDLAKWTLRELKQWMHYMFLIGVEHIYVCDHFHPEDEDLEVLLQQYIALGLVSYCEVSIERAMTAQVECYKTWTNLEGRKSTWMTSVDMDEYPYHMKDKEENFLQRYLQKVHENNSEVAEISMPNYLMLGQGDRTKNITVDRIRRSTPGPANQLVKPIFMPEFYYPNIHRGSLKARKRNIDADPSELRMLHYWGARLQNWGPDTEKVINMTVPFSDMANTWVEKIRNSLLVFGENDAFSSQTGP